MKNPYGSREWAVEQEPVRRDTLDPDLSSNAERRWEDPTRHQLIRPACSDSTATPGPRPDPDPPFD